MQLQLRALLIRNLSHIWEADKFSQGVQCNHYLCIFLTLAATCGTYLLVFCKSTSSVTGWLQVRPVVQFKLNLQCFQHTLLATCRIFSECLENQLSMWLLDYLINGQNQAKSSRVANILKPPLQKLVEYIANGLPLQQVNFNWDKSSTTFLTLPPSHSQNIYQVSCKAMSSMSMTFLPQEEQFIQITLIWDTLIANLLPVGGFKGYLWQINSIWVYWITLEKSRMMVTIQLQRIINCIPAAVYINSTK